MLNCDSVIKEEEDEIYEEAKPDISSIPSTSLVNRPVYPPTTPLKCEPDDETTSDGYRCPHCNLRCFPTIALLLLHYPDCNSWKPTLDFNNTELTSAYRTMSEQVYCPICKKLCKTFFSLSSHLQHQHKTKGTFFKCSSCKYCFKDAYLLKEHLSRASRVPYHSIRCHNSAVVLENNEAEVVYGKQIMNRNRLFPVKNDARCGPYDFRASEVSSMRPRTIKDAEGMEMRRSIYDKRMKVRHDAPDLIPPLQRVGYVHRLELKRQFEQKQSLQAHNTLSLNRMCGVKEQKETLRAGTMLTKKTNKSKEEREKNYNKNFGNPSSAYPLLNEKGIANNLPRATEGEICSVEEMSALRVFSSPVLCPFCKTQQKDYIELHIHLKYYHSSLHSQVVYGCKGCCLRYGDPRLLQNHLLNQYKQSRRLCTNAAEVYLKVNQGTITLHQYLDRFKDEPSFACSPNPFNQITTGEKGEEPEGGEIKQEEILEPVKEEVKEEPETAGYPEDDWH